jgi:hypothetical protein
VRGGKVRGWENDVNFLCLVEKKFGRKEIITCNNLLPCYYEIKINIISCISWQYMKFYNREKYKMAPQTTNQLQVGPPMFKM